ncbi:hypothetical protein [Polaromonas sp.]|uniref:hypothetical protein n=1 Tax=Polaromonas sp. TaxID=1869339 RepID=UPI00286D4864|nr:hypothetical protein [Polaromonas sp.]
MALRINDTAPDFTAETTQGTEIGAGSVSDDDAKMLFPQGWKAPKPYLRIIGQPT